MRTITPTESMLLQEPHRITVWPRLYVYHGTYKKDLTDRFKSAFINFDSESGTTQATFTLNNRDGLLSPGNIVSPYNLEGTADYAPLFWPFREIEYYEAYTDGREPEEEDYKWLFHGYLGSDFQFPSGDPFPTITLLDAFTVRTQAVEIIEAREYSGLAETIIQDLLEEYGLSTPGVEPDFTLWTPTPSDYFISSKSKYIPFGVNLFEAIQKIATGKGWIVYYRYKEDIGKWRPCFGYPDYSRPALADYTIRTESMEDDVDHYSGADIRNSVMVCLADGTEVLRKNYNSIDLYSPKKRNGILDRVERFMAISEDAHSPIDTVSEGDKLARLILHETAYMRGSRNIPLSGPAWHLEWGDLVELQNPHQHITTGEPAQFTRSSPAYLSDGTLVAANQPRYEGAGILVEPGTTNLVPLAKQKFEGWTAFYGATVTLAQNQAVPEWGAVDATRIQTSGGTHYAKYYISITREDGVYYSNSVWVKNIGDKTVNVSSNVSTKKDSVLPGESRRVKLENAGGADVGTLQIQFQALDAADSLDFIAWRPMSEAKPYCTTWTDGTRAPETLSVPGLPTVEGIIEVEAEVTPQSKRQVAGEIPRLLTMMNAAGTYYGLVLRHAPNGATFYLGTRNDAGETSTTYFADALIPNGTRTLKISITTSAVILYCDGVEIARIDNPKLPSGWGRVYLGSSAAGTNHADASFGDLKQRKLGSDKTILPFIGQDVLYYAPLQSHLYSYVSSRVYMITGTSHSTEVDEDGINSSTTLSVVQYNVLEDITPDLPPAPSGLTGKTMIRMKFAGWNISLEWYIRFTWESFTPPVGANLVLQARSGSEFVDALNVSGESCTYIPSERNVPIAYRLKCESATGISYSNEITITLKSDHSFGW